MFFIDVETIDFEEEIVQELAESIDDRIVFEIVDEVAAVKPGLRFKKTPELMDSK